MVDDDADDECGGYAGDLECAEVEDKSADSEYKDCCDYEEVSVFAKVNALNHLKSGYCDEAVEDYADAAEYAARDGVYEGDEGAEEGKEHCQNRGAPDGYNRSIFGYCDAADGFTVGSVGAAAEECACHGAYTVAEEGFVKAGVLKKVALDDGGDVLVVGDMLGKYYEGNRHVEEHQSSEVCKGECKAAVFKLVDGFNEGELGHVEEAAEVYGFEVFYKGGVVDYFECFNAGCVSDKGEDGSGEVACKYAYKEGNELPEALALSGDQDGYKEGNKSADDGNEAVAFTGGGGFGQVGNRVSCKGKTNERNSGSDYDRGHKLVKPTGTNRFDYKGDYYINKSCEERARDNSEEAKHRGGVHRGKKCEGASEEHGAFASGEEKVYYGADACAEERRCGVHFKVCCAVSVCQNRHNDGCGDDCKKLLKREDDKLAELRLIFNIVNKFHCSFLLIIGFCFFLFAENLDSALAVDGRNADGNKFFTGSGDVLANKVRPDGKLPVSAVDDRRKLDICRAALLQQAVDGGSRRPSGINNIVNKNNGLSGNVKGQIRFAYLRKAPKLGKVVAVKRYIKRSDGNIRTLNIEDIVPYHPGNRNSAPLDSHKAEVVRSAVALKYLVRHSDKAAPQCVRVHNISFEFQSKNRPFVIFPSKKALPYGKTAEKHPEFR